MLLATHTNVDYEQTGAIQIIGLGESRFEVVDVAMSHMAALNAAENVCGDYLYVSLCYPGQTIIWRQGQEDEAEAEAERATRAYFGTLMDDYLGQINRTMLACMANQPQTMLALGRAVGMVRAAA